MTRDVSINDFGLVIAYLIPGFAVVWGLAVVTGASDWRDLIQDGPTLGGFLSGTVVSLAAGMTLSTLRWLIIDPLHHFTGIPRLERNFGVLSSNLGAYNLLNDAHYRYYQHHAGMFLATLLVYAAWRIPVLAAPIGFLDLIALALAVLYFLGSRDSLRKLRHRSGQLLASASESSKAKAKRAASVNRA